MRVEGTWLKNTEAQAMGAKGIWPWTGSENELNHDCWFKSLAVGLVREDKSDDKTVSDEKWEKKDLVLYFWTW